MSSLLRPLACLLLLLAATSSGTAATEAAPPPAPSTLPSLASLLGFEPGSRAATPEEIGRCLTAWANASPRARLFEIGTSPGGRPLWNLVLSSPKNLERLERIQEGWSKVADPRGISPRETDSLAATLPPVAYYGFSIHGDELSGADAALRLAEYLLNATGPEAERLLDEVVVVLDPVLNPDGRARYLRQLAEARGTSAPGIRGPGPGTDWDDQSMRMGGDWPPGRGNHYLFDLNRDWLMASQPETRVRIEALQRWNPLLVVDAHEMGAQDSYLFYPPRAPINPYIPAEVQRWWTTFGRDQAAAFDEKAWTYYTGEWADEWYPGYASSWASYRGAVGILYEQAGTGPDAVLRRDGVLTYRDGVERHFTSALANLKTLHDNRRQIAKDFLALRRRAVAAEGPFAGKAWAIPPGSQPDRLARLARLLALHGIELFETTTPTPVDGAVNGLGELPMPGTLLPAGSLLIPARQPEAHLASALLDPDLRLPDATLLAERREVLRHGRTLFYDLSAWSLPLLFGLEVWELPQELPAKSQPYRAAPARKGAPVKAEAVALVADGSVDASVTLAARWLEAGLRVRFADRAFVLDGKSFPRGSLVLLRQDQGPAAGASTFEQALASAAGLEVVIEPVGTGLGDGNEPDLGGRHFRLLERPRVAVLSRGETDASDFGALWHWLETELRLPHTQLDERLAAELDLRRYNVLVLPDRATASLPPGLAARLASWVEQGGTLIASGLAAEALTSTEAPSSVRTLPEVLDQVGSYRLELLREWLTETVHLDPSEVWSKSPPVGWLDPWEELPLPGPEEKGDWQRRDEWQRQFMPQGALLASRIDAESWLTAGSPPLLPILVGNAPVLVSRPPAQALVRLGYAPPSTKSEPEGYTALGWGVIPTDRPYYLRLSGLLWPEAAQRLANAVVVAREPSGAGQTVLFATSPVFRASTPALARLLANAIVYGPGLGAEPPIVP